MSDEDKATYKKILLVAVLGVFAILVLVALGALYAEHACIQLWLKGTPDLPTFCDKGGIQKFVIEFIGLTLGALGAVKLLGS